MYITVCWLSVSPPLESKHFYEGRMYGTGGHFMLYYSYFQWSRQPPLPECTHTLHTCKPQELNHYTKLQVGNGAGERQKFLSLSSSALLSVPKTCLAYSRCSINIWSSEQTSWSFLSQGHVPVKTVTTYVNWAEINSLAIVPHRPPALKQEGGWEEPGLGFSISPLQNSG